MQRGGRYIASHCFPSVLAAICFLAVAAAHATPYRGQVLSQGVPVPGATITATQGSHKLVTVSNEVGEYAFADLADGAWTISVEMLCFAPAGGQVTVAPGAPTGKWELKILPLSQALAQANAVAAPAVQATAQSPAPQGQSEIPAEKPKEEEAAAQEGLLVNGSVNNAATSQFSIGQAFGNTRHDSRSLYTGGLAVILGNSAFDARPYSLSGLETAKQGYNRFRAVATLGGPLRIPHLLGRRGPDFSAVYQWTRNSNAEAESGLVPTVEQRSGSMDPVAQALLALYPLPNVANNQNYNYQIPVLNNSHEDALQTRLNKSVGSKDQVFGMFAFDSTRADTTNLFRFRDATDTLGLDANVNWQHRLASNLYANLGYRFSRLRTEVNPYFENRINISGNAGLTGTNQAAVNWGPPTLVFASGIASLTDAQSSRDLTETNALNASAQWYRGRHNVTAGGDLRWQEFNYFSQPNPRGTFTFTGEAFGSDLADFLHGVPDTAAITSGNPDKYLRQTVYDLYVTDDWRLQPDLTVNLGVRWEYGAPVTELENRLANLDVVSGFTAAAPVVAGSPAGPLTGQRYPRSLLRPDRSRVEPRVAVSWRPLPASSLVVRGGYGIYADTSVYQSIALQLAEQAPFATSVIANNTTCLQSLRSGPQACSLNTSDTFAIDPNFRVGYAQVWQVAVQRDLPGALQMTATYQGIKGSNGVQQFLPNTYPLGVANPCPECPLGFAYRTSTGFSMREAGTVQLRRRLRSGFSASAAYTYSKSIDDDSVLGGQGPVTGGTSSPKPALTVTTAQNWRDLRAERALSSFDQRSLLSAAFQYTTGMGLGGGTLLRGWRGRLYKEWTVQGTILAGTGLPETPVYLAAVNGTGFTGTIRPDRAAAPLGGELPGHYLNAAAYTSPAPGQWGDAGRNSIRGPGQFTFNSSVARTFRPSQRFWLDTRIDATNVLNRVVYASYDTTINPALANPLFGLPTAADAMRSLQITARLRF